VPTAYTLRCFHTYTPHHLVPASCLPATRLACTTYLHHLPPLHTTYTTTTFHTLCLPASVPPRRRMSRGRANIKSGDRGSTALSVTSRTFGAWTADMRVALRRHGGVPAGILWILATVRHGPVCARRLCSARLCLISHFVAIAFPLYLCNAWRADAAYVMPAEDGGRETSLLALLLLPGAFFFSLLLRLSLVVPAKSLPVLLWWARPGCRGRVALHRAPRP